MEDEYTNTYMSTAKLVDIVATVTRHHATRPCLIVTGHISDT